MGIAGLYANKKFQVDFHVFLPWISVSSAYLLSLTSTFSGSLPIYCQWFFQIWFLSLEPWRRQWHPTLVLLPGKSHGWRSLVGYSPWGRKESDTTERLHFHFSLSCIGEGNGSPLQCSCLENPRDGGAWWAAVYGVAQSRTWLQWLGSSSNIYIGSSFPISLPLPPSLSYFITRNHLQINSLHSSTCLRL